jgi:hypothetical protein
VIAVVKVNARTVKLWIRQTWLKVAIWRYRAGLPDGSFSKPKIPIGVFLEGLRIKIF